MDLKLARRMSWKRSVQRLRMLHRPGADGLPLEAQDLVEFVHGLVGRCVAQGAQRFIDPKPSAFESHG